MINLPSEQHKASVKPKSKAGQLLALLEKVVIGTPVTMHHNRSFQDYEYTIKKLDSNKITLAGIGDYQTEFLIPKKEIDFIISGNTIETKIMNLTFHV